MYFKIGDKVELYYEAAVAANGSYSRLSPTDVGTIVNKDAGGYFDWAVNFESQKKPDGSYNTFFIKEVFLKPHDQPPSGDIEW